MAAEGQPNQVRSGNNDFGLGVGRQSDTPRLPPSDAAT